MAEASSGKNIQGKSLMSRAIEEFESTLKNGEPATNESQSHRKGQNPAKRRNVLGRGLSALMSTTAIEVDLNAKEASPGAPLAVSSLPQPAFPTSSFNQTPATGFDSEPLEGGLMHLPIERIVPNATQPRQHFSEAEINELASSIKESGLLQPILVRKRSGESGPLASFEIIAGERRWRAAKQAGLGRIPALVRQLNDQETLEISIVENVQRQDLNPLEEARAFQRLVEEFGQTQEAIAKTVGKDRASVANSLRLLKLPKDLQELIFTGKLSPGHGRALLMLETEEEQREIAKELIEGSLSVRDAERRAQELRGSSGSTKTKKNKAQSSNASDPVTLELEDRLRRALGTKVKVQLQKDGAGELKISFFSTAELDALLERFGA